MALRIEILSVTPSGSLDVFTAATITLACHNDTERPIQIDHAGTRVFLEIRSAEDDQLALIVDEDLRRRFLYAHGLASEPEPVTIPPKSQAKIALDLANYYYPFMAGAYRVVPCFSSPQSGTVKGEAVALDISAPVPLEIREWYENPVFGTHHLLCRYKDGDNTKTSLRWLGLNRPLASFFIVSLAEPDNGTSLFPSIAAFYDLESLKPGLEKVLVWQDSGDAIHIRKVRNGKPEDGEQVCRLPKSATLLPYSFRLQDGTVFAFAMEGGEARKSAKLIRGFRIGSDGKPSTCLEYPLDSKAGLFALAGGPDTIHLVSAGPPLCHFIFSHGGQLAQKVEIGSYKGSALHLNIDLPADSIRAIYLDPEDRRSITAVDSPFPSLRERSVQPRVATVSLAIGKEDQFNEFDFLFDLASRFNVLYSTQRKHLLFFNSELGFTRFAYGESAFFPKLLQGAAPGQQGSTLPFVGFFRGNRGFRFYEAQGIRPWSHLRLMRI